MSPNTGSTIRGDINTVVEEAAQADRFFIGAQVLPQLPVDLKSGTYPKLTKTEGALLKPGSTLREPKASYGEIARTWTTDTYDTQDRGLAEVIDVTEIKDTARFFDMEAITAKLVLRAVMLDHEIRAAALINDAAVFSATAAAVAYTQANIATINFPLDVIDAIERVADNGEEANTIIMSVNVFNRVRQSTLLQNFIRGNRPSDSTLNVNPSAIQQAFAQNGITQVLVGRARYDSAKKGQAFASAKVWGNTYFWVGRVASGDFFNGGAGRTIVWNAEGGLWVSETMPLPERRSIKVVVRQNTSEKIVNAAAGTQVTTSYA